MNTSKSLREYYITGKYKGYYKLRERHYKLSGKVHMTFSNGKKELFAIGKFKEEALNNIFAQIDVIADNTNTTSASGNSGGNICLF
ncbi:hypothetical protein [Fodinibius sp. Rm-B-1B1-1]|uniref:hypothetical protein n=1 Tax=Fodinibius alkaliphilus TaxID=3140241 RepID=UPI00315B23FC